MKRDLRRPMTPALCRLYDEGASALKTGESCPYEPPKRHGDETRAWLWRQGLEDESIRTLI